MSLLPAWKLSRQPPPVAPMTAPAASPSLAIAPAASPSARFWLLVILIVSTGLHLQLARQGGQGYWPDENRYAVAREAATAGLQGNWSVAAGHLLGSADHVFFRFIGLVPALLEHVLFPADAIPPGFSAGFFGLFGVGAIALVWLIARQETGDEPTATWCALFYAGCVTGFFFTRHYFPYDPAICLLLLGWWLGLRSRTPCHHWLTGAVVGLGYLTYNAYWNLGAVILVFHVLRPRAGSSWLARGGWAALGLVTPLLVLIAAARILGYDLITQARDFSHTVTQGGFGQGWRYIPSYFAAAEGAYGVLLLLLAVAGIIAGTRQHRGGSTWLWPAMAGALALELIFFSDVIPRFALSGRSIKPMALFLALSAGLAAGRFKLHHHRGLALGLVALAVGLAAWNFRTPLSLRFPLEFRLEAQKIIAAERARDPAVPLQMYYTGFMHLAEFLPAYPPHTVLLQRRHPLQYRPYQFEGFDAPTRAAFQTHDFSMRLVRVTGAAAWQSDTSRVGRDLQPYAGALQLALDLPEPRPVGHTEPLVTAGIPGQADLFLIHYLDAEQIEILVDHWNWGMVRSDPFRVPTGAGQPQQVVLCAGSLLPPAAQLASLHDPDLEALSQQAIMTWNDRLVLRKSLPLYPTPVSGVAVGGNYVGGTTTEIAFTGKIRAIRQVDPRLLMRRDWGVAALEPTANLDVGRPGPFVAEFEWDAAALQALPAEATVFAASDGAHTSRLTVRRHGADAVFSFWLQGERLVESPPQPVTPGRHQLEIWSPLLASSPGLQAPEARTLREWQRGNFLLQLDGRPIIQHARPALKVAAPETGTGPAPTYFLVGRSWPLDAAAAAGPFPGRFIGVEPVPLDGPVLLRALWRDKLRGTPFVAGAVGPLRLKLRFPPGRAGTREPLLATGSTGAADVLFVAYEPDGRIRIGHDHWGWALLLSELVAVDPTKEHWIDISLGSLYPVNDPAWRPSPLTDASRVGPLYVAVDGQPVLSAERESYFAPLSSVVVGRNLPGSSTCGPRFTGELLEISHLDPVSALPPEARSRPPRQ